MADGEELKNNLSESERILKQIREESAELRNIFAELTESLRKSAKNSTELSAVTKVAASDASRLQRSAAKLEGVSRADLKNKERSRSLAKEAITAASNQYAVQARIRTLQERRLNATEAEKDEIDKVLQDLIAADETSTKLLSNYRGLVDSAEELDKKGKYFSNISKAIKEIPVIGSLIVGGFENARDGLQEASLESDIFKRNLMRVDAIAKGFALPTLATIISGLTSADNSTTNLAKQLGVSKNEARDLRASFNAISIDSGISALNANAMTESMIQLGDTIGATTGFTTQQVVDQTKLTRMVGLQAEEAARLAEFGTLNGEETRSLTEDILEQTAILEKETGLRLDSRKVLSQVANITGQLGAQYGYNTQELARAVVQANRLGLSLEETQGVAANLLDFEQSITNELQAELLIGRDLNLEQARLLALQGDSAGAAAEVAKQFGTAEEFSRLNVIQQQSLAAAVGMSADQLADTIKKQEVLNTLGEKNFDTLMQTEEGRQRISELGGKQLLQQLEQQSASQKFQQSLEKIQSAIGSIVEGPLGSLIDGMADIASSAGIVKTALGLVAGISLVRVIGSIASMSASLVTAGVASAGVASALTLGLSAVAIAAGIGLIMASMSKARKGAEMMPMNDGIIPPGYGDRIISTPKGQIALNNQDTIVAGTNLGQGSNNQETKRTNMLLEKLIQQNTDKPRLSPVGLYEVQ